jgi:hypothetical protein
MNLGNRVNNEINLNFNEDPMLFEEDKNNQFSIEIEKLLNNFDDDEAHLDQ